MIPNASISRLPISRKTYILTLVLSLFLCAFGNAHASELLHDSIFDAETHIERSDASNLIYEPDFGAFDRSILGRAPAEQSLLTNNGPDSRKLSPGATVCYVVDKKTLFGKDKRDDDGHEPRNAEDDPGHQNFRRAESKTVYISVNTCSRPTMKSKDKDNNPETAPQLSLYTSMSSKIKCPDSSNYNKTNSDLKRIPFDEGAAMVTVNATDAIYISVAAPNITKKHDGDWEYQIAISFDEYYHNYDSQNGTARLLLMDTDSTSALLVTSNLTEDSSETQQIMKRPPPYQLFVGDEKLRSIDGLRHSACGLKQSAEIWANSNRTGRHNDLVTTGVTTRGPGQLPKQQFLIAGLNHSSSYLGILVKMPEGNGKRAETTGGGGTVYRATSFETSSSSNCKMVTNLDFCNETQYAVPGNDKKFNNTALAKHYDDYARKMYANFEKVMMQMPCETTPESLYSLVRNCDECRAAYKRWLCTVTIPRCEDVMGGSRFSVVRNAFQAFPNGTTLPDNFRKGLNSSANNSSRNAWIDETVKPGPYKELLPCQDICYDVVQSCPSAIGFTCPQPGFPSFDVSYGERNSDTSSITCNYPGEARTKISAARVIRPGTFMLGVVSLMMWLAV
ncbi:hypothetical protein FGSG_07418 [Fusarium graminearum PH-1]|uniref:Chromosome 4, complete genome n=2 Tax=Gibberella zeae TaxID=5518 RepID=I1RTB7_GIBZE|nr:hypothetical protein FGSG_07418 [Fusarium graminearum PH-1]EYB27459.1 hypothetical protein FG05_07418 [Fusarium graminearum]ESU13681.1 hypothetical protein FGSG_07418 [Fusarium graminearum PH-1]KAI6755267.1 hypothetical protein HG531_004373 [Fusarium graminearum]PCD40829.1 hypothetical protein FGRA07_02100 [Fusarium graminearum]CAF3447130.1 unnamed protein product [Fusarium graminearum]|eukprot:XP_011327188.1 hypothetical protein FGSG_07418 [Fusarium graminearum PH-1]